MLTDNPREVGADRIANAVAAHEMFPESAVVVVDFGTAITVDAVSAKGQYLGGAIAPGLDTSATALFSATANIRRVELVSPPNDDREDDGIERAVRDHATGPQPWWTGWWRGSRRNSGATPA